MGDHSGLKVKLDLPADIELEVEHGWLVKRRTPRTGAVTYAPDTLFWISTPRFCAGIIISVLFVPASGARWLFLRNGKPCFHSRQSATGVRDAHAVGCWLGAREISTPENSVATFGSMRKRRQQRRFIGECARPHHAADADDAGTRNWQSQTGAVDVFDRWSRRQRHEAISVDGVDSGVQVDRRMAPVMCRCISQATAASAFGCCRIKFYHASCG